MTSSSATAAQNSGKEQISLEDLERVVNLIHGVKDITHDEDSVFFKFHDKDGDDVQGYIQISDKKEGHLTALLALAIPASHSFSALIASNSYNQRKDTFGTFSYVGKADEEKCMMVLESDMQVFNELKVQKLIQDFIEHINLWETKMLESIKETGPDSNFIKGGLLDRVIGAALGVVEWLGTPND